MFCLIDRCTSVSSDLVRTAAETLDAAGLLDVEVARALNIADDPRAVAAAQILRHHELSEEEIRLALQVVSEAAAEISSKHLGKIQRLVRPYAETLRNALAEELAVRALPPEELKYAVTQWLQNTASLPISLQNHAVLTFCEGMGCSSDTLFDAADALDINLAVVDDLMALAYDAGEIGANIDDDPIPSPADSKDEQP